MYVDELLKIAQNYADINSGCLKVHVGCLITKDSNIIALGANRCLPNFCITARGCLRVELYGENSKEHRNPEDCRAIHAEIDAIAHSREPLVGSTIYVTRYPCEACAKAIVSAGIAKVVYGRQQPISEYTRKIFEHYNIDVYHYKAFDSPDVLY